MNELKQDMNDFKTVRDALVIFADDEYYGLGLGDVEKAKEALAILDRLTAPVGVPDGYKLVPIEPTPAPTDGYVTVKLGFPNITGSRELVAVPAEFLMSDGSFDRLMNNSTTEKVDVEALKRETYSFSERIKLSDGLPRYSLSEIEIKNYKNDGYNEAINDLAARFDFVRKV